MSDQSQDFTKLQKLLALKRHEQPPPGYFNNFSGGVIAQIRAEQAAGKQPWWQDLLGRLRMRPAMAAFSGAAVMVAMVFGLSLALQEPPAGQSLTTGAKQPGGKMQDSTLNPGGNLLGSVPVVDTNGTARPPQGIFDPQIKTQPVGFQPK